MTNISCFYPEREKGWALGLNAAGGNIGVAVVQAPVRGRGRRSPPAVGIHLGRAGLMYIPLALLAAFARLALHGQPDGREDRLRLQRRRRAARGTPG